jgi:hypothetical protein
MTVMVEVDKEKMPHNKGAFCCLVVDDVDEESTPLGRTLGLRSAPPNDHWSVID